MKKSLLIKVLSATCAVFVFILAGQVSGAHVVKADTWVSHPDAGALSWTSVDSSADGTKLVAVEQSGGVYISNDSGATWNRMLFFSGWHWNTATISADGNRIAVGAPNSQIIYTSTNGGTIWGAKPIPGGAGALTLGSSADGMRLALLNGGDDIMHISTDAGNTWNSYFIATTTSHFWTIGMSDDGMKLAVGAVNYDLYTSSDGGHTWNEQTNSGKRSWYGIASSADGMKLAATDYNIPNALYTSTDGGSTWIQRTIATPGVPGYSLASSADGSTLITGTWGGGVYISRDSGNTWTLQPNTQNKYFGSVTSSADGKKFAAANYSEYLYTNTTSCPWTPLYTLGQKNWNGVALSGDGSRLAVTNKGNLNPNPAPGYGQWDNHNIYTLSGGCPNYSLQNAFAQSGKNYFFTGVSAAASSSAFIVPETNVYVSRDGGMGWQNQSSIGTNEWTSQTSSADGYKLAVTGDHIYTSTDGGGSWTKHTTGIPGITGGFANWKGIASSADGMKLVAIDYGTYGMTNGGYIYTSKDAGNTWVQSGAPQKTWNYVASSPDGIHVAATVDGGNIFVSNDSGATWLERTDVSTYHNWTGLTMWMNGTNVVLLAIKPNVILKSEDDGFTWLGNIETIPQKNWSSIAASSDGCVIAVTDANGYVYVGSKGSIFSQSSGSCSYPGTTPTPGLTLTSITPSSAHMSDTVTVSGSGFTNGNIITFTNRSTTAPALYTVIPPSVTPTSFSLYIPSSIPAGIYDVSVKSNGIYSNTLPFTVTSSLSPIANLSASQNGSYTTGGKPVYLSWSTTNVTSCIGTTNPILANPSWTNPALSGTLAVSPAVTTTYTLSCSGSYGSASKSVTVNVAPAQPIQPVQPLQPAKQIQAPMQELQPSQQTSYVPWTMQAAVEDFWRTFTRAF